MSSGTKNYWWIKTNPKRDLEKCNVGDTFTCDRYNENGNKRRISKSFEDIKQGDSVILYVTSPQQKVVSICKITKGLHLDEIELQIVERLTNPIPYETLQTVRELKNIEPFRIRQGTLFSLSKEQYELIRAFESPVAELVADIQKIKEDSRNAKTTMQALVNARLGQGKFGAEVRKNWDNRCAVTRVSTAVLLESSHIKRWAKCTDAERLDPENGLLLTANLHRLFDAGLIAFQNSGKMCFSQKLTKRERLVLGLNARTLSKKPSAKMAKYFSHHRKNTFKPRT